jgi:hypothetical protein
MFFLDFYMRKVLPIPWNKNIFGLWAIADDDADVTLLIMMHHT